MESTISWNSITKATLALTLLVPMLAACGGGGGSGGGQSNLESSPGPSLPNISYPVNPASARQAVAGSIAPTQTAAQAVQRLHTIVSNANSVVATDVVAFLPAQQQLRFPLSCSGTRCSGSFQGEPYSFQLNSPSSANLNEIVDYDIAEIQPVMVHNGVNIGQIRARSNQGTADQVEAVYYGGWMEHSYFAVQIDSFPSVANPDFDLAVALSVGDSTGTNPTSIAGRTATWTGSVVGGDYSTQYFGHVIYGTATVTVDFGASNVDVEFSNLVDVDATGRSISNMNWDNIAVSSGKFLQGSGTDLIRGQFYGPNHEEVGGAFDRNQIGGAFGAIRGTQ